MSGIPGHWYDGTSSRRHAATLHAMGAALCVRVEGREITPLLALANVQVSDRLGNTPRVLRFPGGGSFETDDNGAIDRLLATHRPRSGWVHALESRWTAIAAALVIVVAFVYAAVRVGVPWAANAVATALPPTVSSHLDEQVLGVMDKQLFKPSTLDAETLARIQAAFAPVLTARPVHVEFRSADGTLGPNALALPGGTVVFTDELVRLADDDRQLIAVLAHELAHVEKRHALRQTLQASLLSLLAVAVVGDVSAASDLVTTIPLTLTQLGYSREFEREADRQAVATLRRHGIDPVHFENILGRLDAWHRCENAEARQCTREGDLLHSYLATHPPMAERIDAIHATP